LKKPVVFDADCEAIGVHGRRHMAAKAIFLSVKSIFTLFLQR
jgi:hypothetical protein